MTNMDKSNISIKGAKVNNLKNIDIEIPRNKFIVITGLSGSGKSSLAFDTLYAEMSKAFLHMLDSLWAKCRNPNATTSRDCLRQ